jgi:hypothetical protein
MAPKGVIQRLLAMAMYPAADAKGKGGKSKGGKSKDGKDDGYGCLGCNGTCVYCRELEYKAADDLPDYGQETKGKGGKSKDGKSSGSKGKDGKDVKGKDVESMVFLMPVISGSVAVAMVECKDGKGKGGKARVRFS